MIDSHCHFDFPDFDSDRTAEHAKASALGVKRLLVPGVSIEHFARQITLQQKFKNVDLAFGLHPYFLSLKSIDHLAQVEQFITEQLSRSVGAPVAVGEIGLDYAIQTAPEYQKRVFEVQLQMAQNVNLPVILHHRKSHNDIIATLKKHKFTCGGVVHAFSGSTEVAKQYIDMGFYLGVGGTITYARANKTRQALENLGLAHLLLETDAPDMPLFGHQGQRNAPSHIPEIAANLAQLLETSIEQVEATTDKNYVTLFKVPHNLNA